MPTLERPDGTLVYDVTGSGAPLFLVTGLGGSRGYWGNVLPDLASRFTVVTHDHMGTGETVSRRATHRVDTLAADVVALMDHLGVDRTHLIGHSTGAAVGQVMAQDAPGRLDKLVLYAGWAGPDPFFDLCFAARKTLLTSAGIEAYHRGTPLFLYPPRWVSEDCDRLQRLVAAFIATSPPLEVMAGRIDMLLAFDRRARMADIAVPTLVLCAEDDFLTPMHCSEELAAGIPGARLVRLAYGGHAASQTAPAAFLQAVGSFL